MDEQVAIETGDSAAPQLERPIECEEAKILSIDVEKRRVTHVISTGRLDRGNRMVEPSGWKLGNFRRAPRVLADHDYSIERVIGRALDTKVQGDALVSTTEFDTEGLGAVAFRLVQNNLVNTWSVGWMGLTAHLIGEIDDCAACKAAKPKLGKSGYGRHFVEQELLEYSLVAIPANPDAVNPAAAVRGLEAAGLVPHAAAEQWYEAFGAPPPQRSPAFCDALAKLARSERRRTATMLVGQQMTSIREASELRELRASLQAEAARAREEDEQRRQGEFRRSQAERGDALARLSASEKRRSAFMRAGEQMSGIRDAVERRKRLESLQTEADRIQDELAEVDPAAAPSDSSAMLALERRTALMKVRREILRSEVAEILRSEPSETADQSELAGSEAATESAVVAAGEEVVA